MASVHFLCPKCDARQARESGEEARPCERCGNIAQVGENGRALCPICLDSRRDGSLLCIVARVQDLMAIEKSAAMRGRYFVLGRLLSPLDGIGPDELPLREMGPTRTGAVRHILTDRRHHIAYSAALTSPADTSQPQQPQITLNERVIPAQIQGNHASVVRFLNAISRYPRIIYIREFSITSLSREETVNLTLVTYDAPTSGILPPIPSELRDEFQSQGANATARLTR